MCVTFQLHFDFLFYSKLATPSSICPFFYPTVASNSYSSWDESPSNLWTLQTFSNLANMNHDNLASPVAAAATAQVKLCPHDEEEPHIWFRLIKAQFAVAGIKSQKFKYDNALAGLPKQVLRDILDTLDVSNDSAEPFDFLKHTLLGQFGKSKWQSYFGLLPLPMELQGLKPSVLMGKFKQHLPPGVSPDNDLFLSMFLNRLPPSMREAVGAGTHETTAAMMKAADVLWDAEGGHNPTVAAALTQRRRSSAPTSEKRGDKRSSNGRSKNRPPSHPDFFSFQNPGNGMCKFHNYYAHKAHRCAPPCAWSENYLAFDSAANPTHATAKAMHFPAYAGLIFLTDKLTNDRYFVDTGATLSIVTCSQNASPSGPVLKGAEWQPIPSWGFITKIVQFSRQAFYSNLFASRCGWSHPGY